MIRIDRVFALMKYFEAEIMQAEVFEPIGDFSYSTFGYLYIEPLIGSIILNFTYNHLGVYLEAV